MELKPTIYIMDSNGKALESYWSRQLVHVPRIGESVKLRVGVQNVVAKVTDVVHTFDKNLHTIEVYLGRMMVNTGE